MAQTAERRRIELGGRTFVAFIATCMAMAAMSIDLLLPAFPDMRTDFGLPADSTQPSRLITAFFLGLAVGQLVYGPLSDRYGRKPMLYAGLVIYVIGALAATQAQSLAVLVACRAVWGFGAAAPRSLAIAMVRDTQRGERMARTMSHVMATFILVPILAPAVGTALISVAQWRVVFWLPAIAAVCLAAWATRLPETLAPEHRRPASVRSLGQALVAVSRNRQTVGFGLAVTFLFGVMTGYVGSAEIIVDKVYDQSDHFALFFGLVACLLGVGSLLSARLVMQLGLERLVRIGALYMLAASAFLAVAAVATDGKPPLWVFGLGAALILGGVALTVPNCNTAAMTPMGHVAGMAAALLGTVSTAGGALLGSQIDSAFDGTVQPFAVGALVLVMTGAFCIFVVAGRPQPIDAAEAAVDAALSVSVADAVVPGEA